jgi:dTDP-4-amino-4,6-dideoxygalactose transaminase
MFFICLLSANNRQELQDYLLKNGVQTAIHYPPATQTKALQQYHELSFLMHDEVLSIPLNPVLSGKEVDFIITALNKY